MIRFVELGIATYSGNHDNVYSVRVDGEHIGYFIGTDKYARAIETAVTSGVPMAELVAVSCICRWCQGKSNA